jgi:photosystem II stability/assembly factor-like uncharacterized protein
MKKSFLIVIPIFTFLAVSPLQCQKMSDGGLYISENMGESWQQQTIRDKQLSITSLDILSLAIDPNNSDVLYLGAREDGIYRSCSQGKHWYKLEDRNEVLSSRANVYDIAIDPQDSQRLYVGVYQDKKGRVFRTQDGGESWEEVYVVSKEKYAVFALAIDNYDPSIVYMGTAQGGFLKSSDYGKSWELMKWFDDVISDIAVNPQDTQIVYVSTFEEGIYKTTDKGNNWQSFEEDLKEFRQAKKVEKIIVDPQRPHIIYAGSEYGLLTSKDEGETWQEVKIIMPPKSEPVLSLIIEPQNTDHLYYGAGPILYRSLDQGINWTVHELPSQRNVKTIAIDPEDPNLIYAGMHK